MIFKKKKRGQYDYSWSHVAWFAIMCIVGTIADMFSKKKS